MPFPPEEGTLKTCAPVCRREGGESDKLAVGEILAAGYGTVGDGGRNEGTRRFARVDRRDIEVAGAALSEEVAAVGRPVGNGEVVADFLDDSGLAGAACRANNDAGDAVG
jgi:hypothetical protein